jgi:N6-L-threonylcarbamoyladenine synthase
MAIILGIESTCDETAAAVVVDGREVRSNAVATQFELHAKFRGVVPEIASRAHIENILPVLKEALEGAGVSLEQIDAVAVAHRPGLIGSLLVGVMAAKTLAWSMGKPLIGVDHVQAHLYSVMLEETTDGGRQEARGKRQEGEGPAFPAVGLVCSGGHTALYEMRSFEDVKLIGTTIDDAVGEAYDKVAAVLGLGFPGGPIVDGLAMKGDAKVNRFPRTMLGRESLDFSFSGLKTAVLYRVRGVPGKGGWKEEAPKLSEKEVEDIAAGFQEACVDVIVKKLRRALGRVGGRSVIMGGGVSANRGLRSALARFDVPVFFPALRYCTDNAAMIAGLGDLYYHGGQFSSLDLDAVTYSKFAV